jgi:hypothetical protein
MTKSRRGQSEASKLAWERNRKFGMLRYSIGYILTLGSLGIITPAEVAEATAPLQRAAKRYYKEKES